MLKNRFFEILEEREPFSENPSKVFPRKTQIKIIFQYITSSISLDISRQNDQY